MFWESAVEENTEIMMESSFHMQCNSPSAGLGKLGSLNISNPRSDALEELSSEHMSFYDDDVAQPASHNENLWHSDEQLLLPEEGPAQRFHIIAKPNNFHKKSLLQQYQQHHQQQQQQPQQRPQDATNLQEKRVSRGFRVFNSLSSSCSMESSCTEDEEYMDLLEMESLEAQLQQEQQQQKTSLGLPSNLNSLISGQIKSSLTGTPERRRPSVRRCLSLTDNTNEQFVASSSPKTPEQKQLNYSNSSEACTTPFSSRTAAIERCNANNDDGLLSSFCFKRPEPPSVTNSPILSKRYRGEEKENLAITNTTTTVQTAANAANTTTTTSNRVCYRKSVSMNDAEIMSALARSDIKGEPDLIGDFSKPFVLPLMDGRHRDLKTISSDTVARLISGEFAHEIANFTIIDCRYPYEYEGGHISGAKNLYTQEQIVEEFLTQQKTEQQQARSAAAGNKRNIIIFHCEFSSERGPRLSRFLRNNDRERNTSTYPTLDYPEIYLLHNGYKEFYETHSELCVPNAYRPMLEPSYNDAYRHFRAKSKTWNGDGLGGATSRLKKSRSRLML